MRRWRLSLLPLVAAILAACDASAGGTQSVVHGDPTRYLLGLDQLVSPDFTVVETARAVDAATLAGGDATLKQQLLHDGFSAASRVRYFRQADLAIANGPIDVTSTVAILATASGAHDWFRTLAAHLYRSAGKAPLSTGALGDEAHADTLVRTTAGGISVVQVTLEWRVANAVNVLVVRGRYGGTRLDDALVLAHRVTVNELPGM